MSQASVTATDEALQAIGDLRVRHGPLAFFQSAGCCDGSLPICLEREELPPGPGDTLLGELDGTPFYIDEELHRRWGSPSLVLDVRPGAAEGFSLGPAGAHFVTSPAPVARPGRRF